MTARTVLERLRRDGLIPFCPNFDVRQSDRVHATRAFCQSLRTIFSRTFPRDTVFIPGRDQGRIDSQSSSASSNLGLATLPSNARQRFRSKSLTETFIKTWTILSTSD